MRVIGISNKTRYWQHYVFTTPPDGYRYARMVDVPWHVMRITNRFLANTKLFFPLRRADLFHTYNGIVANRSPWIIEVESILPRYRMGDDRTLWRWAMRRLVSDDCKAILFSSEHTARANRDKLIGHGVDPAKMSVLYRAVERYLPGEKPTDHFHILFVGNGFYRKGGIELLKALQILGRPDVRLTVVSSLEVDWAVTPTDEQVAWAKKMLIEDPRIRWVPRSPHHEVAQLMRRAHVFVNTTFGDTFNNAVMEALGCRVPVIVSDVSALPEMVEQGSNGFMVPVRERTSDQIAEELAAHLGRLIDDPILWQRMSDAAYATACTKFDVRIRNRRLVEVYDRALR